MGRQIVYCEGCGTSLREDDFERGRAHRIDNKPFCIECRPLPEEAAQPPPRRGSEPKVAKGPEPKPASTRKTTTGSIPIIRPPRPAPAPAPAGGSNPLPILAGVGALALILILVLVSQSGGGGASRETPQPYSPPPEPPRTPVGVTPPPPPPPVTPPRDPPPTPPVVRRDPPVDPKPAGPLVAPSASEKLDAFLGQIRQKMQESSRLEQTEEILNMLAVATKTAGPRFAEVEKLKAEYLATLDEPTRKAAVWRDWTIKSSQEAGSTGLLPSYGDRISVYMTHPLDQKTPATLEREVTLPFGRKVWLTFWVSCHAQGDFELRVYADDKQLLKEVIGPAGSGWREKKVELTSFAGKKVKLRLEDFANDWKWEHAYWSDPAITVEN